MTCTIQHRTRIKPRFIRRFDFVIFVHTSFENTLQRTGFITRTTMICDCLLIQLDQITSGPKLFFQTVPFCARAFLIANILLKM